MPITKHAAKRIRDRLGIPKKSAEANAEKALQNGVDRLQTTGSLRRYLDYLWWNDTPKEKIIVYHRYVYIFSRSTLITVLHLPRRFYDAATKQNIR